MTNLLPEMTTGWFIYYSAVVFAFGACIGSFLNVCIYRMPLEQSIVRPGSHCPKCDKPIAWRDNIPILSYLLLQGRCRGCKVRISPRYVLVELLVAVLFLVIWIKYKADPRTPVYWLVVSGLVLGTFVDFEHMIIPDTVSIGGIVSGIVLSFFVPALHRAATMWEGLQAGVVGAVVGFGLLWLVSVIGRMIFKKDAMGFGDVKLLGAIGAFMGWRSVLFTIMVSSLLGSIVGVTFILSGRKEWQSRIPYGPYLALAALIWLLCGAEMWDAYVNWLLAEPIESL